METIIRSSKRISQVWLKASVSLLAFTMILTFQSCQKSESDIDMQGPVNLKNGAAPSGTTLYYGHKVFTRGTGEPFVETDLITNPYSNCYENLTLFIKNGNDKKTRVSSAEISIDGVIIAGPSDFSKNVLLITKPISGLSSESTLEVKLNSAPGSYIDLWIEATSLLITPVFTQIGPVVQDSEPPVLPAVSENGITGLWSPETINTSTAGIFTFTFTPDEGQCAPAVTMDIEIINRGTVSDVAGNLYRTVKIGSQWWMAENLKTTLFTNGESIATTTSATLNINGETSPRYQWAFNGNEYWATIYGRLYTWFAATDSRGVCPVGWHVPAKAEWTALTDYLTVNGYGYEGSGDDIAKSMAATSRWFFDATPGSVGNDPASNNSSGFSALPGGFRLGDGTFNNKEFEGIWWSSDNGYYRVMFSSVSQVGSSSTSTKQANSVRCVKN